MRGAISDGRPYRDSCQLVLPISTENALMLSDQTSFVVAGYLENRRSYSEIRDEALAELCLRIALIRIKTSKQKTPSIRNFKLQPRKYPNSYASQWNYSRGARYSVVANCQRELLFLLSVGRRSAHCRGARRINPGRTPQSRTLQNARIGARLLYFRDGFQLRKICL